MIKIHNSPAFAIALICCGLFATTAFAQNKEADDSKVDPSKTKTSEYREGDNQVTKTDRFNKKGVLLTSDKKTITPYEGIVEEVEIYENGKLTSKHTTRTKSGKVIESQYETYKDGILISGEILVLKPGDTYQTVIKRYDDGQQKYVDVPLEEQRKQAEELKKFEENLKKYRKLGETLWELRRSGKVSYESSGTGETIGHIADVTVQNLSNESLNFYFPPTIVESKSNKYQDYAAPRGQDVALKPGETKTISVMGTCLERDKLPEPPGQTGDIVLDDGNPTTRSFDWYKTTPDIVTNILRIIEVKYEAADKLEGEGRFKDFPYHDQQKQKDIVVQHSTWEDPRISEWVHSPPEDEEDFKKNIDDQAKQHGTITRDIRKKLDKGTNTMWDGIELTSEKAKDLEQPEQRPGGTFEISDETGDKTESPPPKTEEKKTQDMQEEANKAFEKREERKKKKEDWKEKEKLVFTAVVNKGLAQQKYNNALVKYCLANNKDYKDLREKRDEAEKKAKEWDTTVPTKNEKDAAKKDKEAFQQADEALKKLEAELEKDFQKTEEGKKDLENLNNEKKALGTAEANEKEAKDAYKKVDAEAKALAKELKGEKPAK